MTQAGLEVDVIDKVNTLPSSIVVGLVVAAEKHPQADKLKVCQVDVGLAELISIVCGCATVKAGLKVAVAKVGSVLPKGLAIASCKLRGVESSGMLCSAVELGLAQVSSGIMHLKEESVIGSTVADYLQQLEDQVLQVEITPNRGDCLSVLGLAREISSINFQDFRPLLDLSPYVIKFDNVKAKVAAQEACLRYSIVELESLDLTQPTPQWMLDRLALFKQQPVNLFVDVINYVMFELGQPMHGYDADKLVGEISVGWAQDGSSIKLLSSQEQKLSATDLVIKR